MLERAHVVQAVGQLDDDHANVGHHGKKHLADVLGLVVFTVGELDLVELGDAFDDVRHLLAKALGDLGRGDIGVFDRIVQQAGGDGGRVHLQLSEHLADLKRMNHVGLARGALLALVLLQAEGPGLADDLEVVAGPVLVHRIEQSLELDIDGLNIAECESREMRCGRLSRDRGIRAGKPCRSHSQRSRYRLYTRVNHGIPRFRLRSALRTRLRAGLPGGRISDCHRLLYAVSASLSADDGSIRELRRMEVRSMVGFCCSAVPPRIGVILREGAVKSKDLRFPVDAWISETACEPQGSFDAFKENIELKIFDDAFK